MTSSVSQWRPNSRMPRLGPSIGPFLASIHTQSDCRALSRKRGRDWGSSRSMSIGSLGPDQFVGAVHTGQRQASFTYERLELHGS